MMATSAYQIAVLGLLACNMVCAVDFENNGFDGDGENAGQGGEAALGFGGSEIEYGNHQFIFVAGPHHSGTTLISLLVGKHPEAAGLLDTGKPQDEGQHLQDIYPKAYNLGGMLGYAHNLHLTEKSELCTPENSRKLYESWKPFWNLDQKYLVEKTPNHMVMTRFLQCLFKPERTHFLITLRHPFGASFFKWKLPSQLVTVNETCGEKYIEHWLAQMDTLKEDIRYLQNVKIVMFENFTVGDIQENYNALLQSMHLTSTKTHVKTEARSPRVDFTNDQLKSLASRNSRGKRTKGQKKKKRAKSQSPPRRKLMGYRLGTASKRNGTITPRDIVIRTEPWMNWIKSFESRFGKYGSQPQCKALFDRFETRVNEYGYSLRDPTLVTMPRAFEDYVVVPVVDNEEERR